MDLSLSPSPRRDRALARGLAALLLLGAHHASVEYRPAFALWSIGRPAPWSWAPPCALLALHLLALAMLLTRWTRASAAVACAVIAALYAAVPATYHNNHYLLFLLLLLTALAPTAPTAPIDLSRAFRWQLSLVYLSSVAVKLAHPWWRGSGSVIRWLATTRAPEANPSALLSRALSPLLSRPLPSRLADVSVTALEVALPLGLCLPRTRSLCVAVGVLLHLSMQEWLFPQLFTFLMLLGYFAWSPADDRAWTLALPRHDSIPGRAARALDLLGRLQLIATPGLTRCSLTDPSGRCFHGLAAALQLASLTPWTVVAYAALALLFPEVRAVGPIPRDALENILVGSLVLAFAATSLLHRGSGHPGRKSSHPIC
jgi:hypothetical protein